MDLSGKKILVTGASSGIGQATAILISRLGGSVILNGRDEGRLYATLSRLEGDGHYVMPYDLLNFDGVKAYVSQCVALDGRRFDGLVFSAGIGKGTPLRVESIENCQKIMQTNYFAYLSMLKVFASKRIMLDGGSIVALSSSAVEHYDKSLAGYAGSKAAVEALSAVAAKEFSARRIRINTVRPEMTRTPMTTGFFSSTTEEERKTWYPLGALAPEDVADTIVFLLSDMSRKLTGQNIYLSAGNDGRPIDFWK